MPPKSRITREMIVTAATEIIRQSGLEAVNARTVAEKLNCSTQPVLYHFASMEELKRAAYTQADQFHTDYLMTQTASPSRDPLLSIGLNYIRFAIEQPHLFRFLFQSGYARENSLLEMIDSQELVPVLEAMQAGSGLGMDKTKQIFLTVALFAHGYASIIANNGLAYDERLVAEHLERTWNGAFLAAVQEEKEHEEPV